MLEAQAQPVPPPPNQRQLPEAATQENKQLAEESLVDNVQPNHNMELEPLAIEDGYINQNLEAYRLGYALVNVVRGHFGEAQNAPELVNSIVQRERNQSNVNAILEKRPLLRKNHEHAIKILIDKRFLDTTALSPLPMTSTPDSYVWAKFLPPAKGNKAELLAGFHRCEAMKEHFHQRIMEESEILEKLSRSPNDVDLESRYRRVKGDIDREGYWLAEFISRDAIEEDIEGGQAALYALTANATAHQEPDPPSSAMFSFRRI
ncbi:hypothetical protein VNI00_016010 [Paramarasmius palmivorus]|uniref:Uncharacterized protein n=1 Tax=Paramarasmius palmivorus TaxID=297713 RepID=A0AAW0BGL7_9AGAR